MFGSLNNITDESQIDCQMVVLLLPLIAGGVLPFVFTLVFREKAVTIAILDLRCLSVNLRKIFYLNVRRELGV